MTSGLKAKLFFKNHAWTISHYLCWVWFEKIASHCFHTPSVSSLLIIWTLWAQVLDKHWQRYLLLKSAKGWFPAEAQSSIHSMNPVTTKMKHLVFLIFLYLSISGTVITWQLHLFLEHQQWCWQKATPCHTILHFPNMGRLTRLSFPDGWPHLLCSLITPYAWMDSFRFCL